MFNQLQYFFSAFTKRDVFILGGVLAIAAAIPIGVWLVFQQNIPSQAGTGPAVMSIVPGRITKAAGETVDVQIFLDTAGRTVWSIGASLTFDAAVLDPQQDKVNLQEVFPGQQVQQNRVEKNGKILLGLGANLDTKQGFSGVKSIGSVKFLVKNSSKASANINFEPVSDNKVYEAGNQDRLVDILGTVSPAIITISGQASVPGPTATISPSPTAGATVAPTATVTPTPTVAQASPTSTPTPTPTPVPSSQKTLTIKLKLQGIDQSASGKNRQATVSIAGTTISNKAVTAVVDGAGNVSATLDVSGLPAGAKDVSIQVAGYKKEVLTAVNVAPGATVDKTSQVIKAGDVGVNPQDAANAGKIDSYDVQLVVANLGKNTETYDLDADGIVSARDLSLVLSNYGK